MSDPTRAQQAQVLEEHATVLGVSARHADNPHIQPVFACDVALKVEEACRAGGAALRAPSPVQEKGKPRTMEFFATKFAGFGVGKVGDCCVVVRTARNGSGQFIQILDDIDGVGIGFTSREVPALIEALTKALSALSLAQEQK